MILQSICDERHDLDRGRGVQHVSEIIPRVMSKIGYNDCYKTIAAKAIFHHRLEQNPLSLGYLDGDGRWHRIPTGWIGMPMNDGSIANGSGEAASVFTEPNGAEALVEIRSEPRANRETPPAEQG